jgi:hypothetical protein
MARVAVLVVVCGLLLVPRGGTEGRTGILEPSEREALSKYCYGCHNSSAKMGDFALDPNGGDSHWQSWEKVVKKLRLRAMPPPGMPRPDEATYTKVLSSLESSLDARAKADPNPGRTATFRRLNRTEYQNVIRDLLHLEVDVSDLLPADESSYGFDNVTVGNLSPTLMERYLAAARKISRLAIGTPPSAPDGTTFTLPPDLTQEQHFKDLPIGTRGGLARRFTFPADAEYEMQIRLARDRNEHVEGLREPHQVDLLLDGQRIKSFEVQPPPKGQDHSLVDQHLRLRIPVKAGPHVVAVTFPGTPFALIERERQPYQAHFNMDRHPRIRPAVYSLTVNGPFKVDGPGDTPSRQRLLICTPTAVGEEKACAEQIFSTLMRRAWRRPVAKSELQVPMRFYWQARETGNFEQGIEMGLSAVLVSPEFLFRIERDPAGLPAGQPYRVDEVALASRLSFFLWSSIPDDQLLNLAISGTLRDPAVLQQQTERMLADPRARTLVTNFAEQWLHLRNLDSAHPDMRLFADFDDNLRQAFRTETHMLFESILAEDRSVLDLIHPHYTFVNERLAKHYGLPNVYGSRFRRISLPEGSVRGGLLRHGSVLTVSSYATRTSPVIRGKWVLDNLLGAPPPPPPPSVPALKEERHQGGKFLTMRQRLAEHRDNPACASCHNAMDPIGFALENFDAVGRWRTRDGDLPVDSAGGFPDGAKFDGVAGLEQALLNRPDVFATTVTEKLLTYALGRGIEFYDAPAVRQVVREAKASNYKLTAIVAGIVRSTPFQMRRAE